MIKILCLKMNEKQFYLAMIFLSFFFYTIIFFSLEWSIALSPKRFFYSVLLLIILIVWCFYFLLSIAAMLNYFFIDTLDSTFPHFFANIMYITVFMFTFFQITYFSMFLIVGEKNNKILAITSTLIVINFICLILMFYWCRKLSEIMESHSKIKHEEQNIEISLQAADDKKKKKKVLAK